MVPASKASLAESMSRDHLDKKLDDYIANVEKIKELKEMELRLSQKVYGTATAPKDILSKA